MMQIRRKLHSSGGYSLLLLILLIAVFVMLVIVLLPRILHYKEEADNYGCKVAMNKTQDMLDVEFLNDYGMTLEQADEVIHRAMWEQDWLCPSGGDYFVVDRGGPQLYRVTCGLHESDTLLRTELNAKHAFSLLKTELELAETTPRTVTLTLNSMEFTAQGVETEPTIRRGTKTTKGFDGTVIYFMADNHGNLRYFCYADENHCAIWRLGEDWYLN